MDIARPELKRQKRRRQILWGSIAIVVLIGVTVGISRLKPAAPTVDRSTIWTDSVKRGSMLRQVRGLGTLDRKSTRLNSSHANIYSLPLHDALPIYLAAEASRPDCRSQHHLDRQREAGLHASPSARSGYPRSEEHTSELQSRQYLLSSPTRRSSDLSRG